MHASSEPGEGRDGDGDGICNKWKAEGKGKMPDLRSQAQARYDDGTSLADNCAAAFDAFLHDRLLDGILFPEGVHTSDGVTSMMYGFHPAEHQAPLWFTEPTAQRAYHGTTLYALMSIIRDKALAESNDETKGHGILHHGGKDWHGVYTSPNIGTAAGYAVPQITFKDGIWHCVIIEVLVNNGFEKRITQSNTNEKKQWVHHSEDVHILRVHLSLSSPPYQGQARYYDWKPELECRNPGELLYDQIGLLPGGRYGPLPKGGQPPWKPPALALVAPQSKASSHSSEWTAKVPTCTTIVPAVTAPWK